MKINAKREVLHSMRDQMGGGEKGDQESSHEVGRQLGQGWRGRNLGGGIGNEQKKRTHGHGQ